VGAEPWRALYESELQSVWALIALPAGFLVYAALGGRARAARSDHPQARFVWLWSLAFAAETILDPLATGPLSRALQLPDSAREKVMLAFVLLGDWRVLLPVFALASAPGRRAPAFARSAALTLAVPVFAYATDRLLRSAWPGLPGQALWLAYEIGFLALALSLRRFLLPHLGLALGAERALRALLAWAALYYALWGLADALILAGIDAGWGLRILPNQLYYALTVPFFFFVYFRRSG
jgi:hypothetical protein